MFGSATSQVMARSFPVDVPPSSVAPFRRRALNVKSNPLYTRLLFVEFRLEDPKVPIKLVHKMSEKQVKKEMEPHPLRWVETIDKLPWQHLMFFQRDDAPKAK